MKVKARIGLKVPFEHSARQFIDQNVVDVPNTLYYRRLLLDGDLIKVNEKSVKRTTKVSEVEVSNKSKGAKE